MSEYSSARALADRLIRKKGGVLTLTRTTPGVYDPATGVPSAPTVTVYTGSAFRQVLRLSEVERTEVASSYVIFLISSLARDGTDFPPPAPSTDVLTFGGKNYSVVGAGGGSRSKIIDYYNFDGISNVAYSIQAAGIA